MFQNGSGRMVVSVAEAVGLTLAHDITEIRPGEFKGRAFRRGQVIKPENLDHLRRLGKEHLYVLKINADELHEDDAALCLAQALIGPGVAIEGEPKEGKINIIAARDGLFKVNRERLLRLNLLGEVMCATIHSNTLVKKGATLAGVRAIPLTINKSVIDEALGIIREGAADMSNFLEVREIRRAKVGVIVTGKEIFEGRIKDAFAPIIAGKIRELGGEVIRLLYAPDDISRIESGLRELIAAGADLLIATGGMSVDPDDVTRFAIRNLGAKTAYGSAVLPGAMLLVGSVETEDGDGKRVIPIIGIPACGMYHRTTVLDLVLPRILAGETIGRKELAELGHGGLCLGCPECRFPLCPFGKA
ncbi:MAG: molybdopterin-binding protein [Smithellaceae bacterium]|nr:molybdopterin-binding protein [Smithellaceae bacterium]